MQVTLQINTGEYAGRRVSLRGGQRIKVGRAAQSGFPIACDRYLSGLHFALECDDDACRIRDLESGNGTFLNGRGVSEAVLDDQDEILAGETSFLVSIESAEQSPGPVDLLEFLGEQGPLFAILDAARDARVLHLLGTFQGKAEYQTLYAGARGEELGAVAPYLVRFPAETILLETLVREGWGKGWGLFLTCDEPFSQLRKHLRHFLMVKAENGRRLYFRFYDPRVLRVFLPTCRANESMEFFGPISRYMVESGRPGTLLQFTDNGNGVYQKELQLCQAGAGEISTVTNSPALETRA